MEFGGMCGYGLVRTTAPSLLGCLPFAGPVWLQKSGEVTEMCLGDPWKLVSRTPLMYTLLFQRLIVLALWARTGPHTRVTGGGAEAQGERRDLRGLSQFVVQSLLSTCEGTRPSVCKYRAKPRPSGVHAVVITLSELAPHCSPATETTV